MTCIPNNTEKFITFKIGDVTFKDSYAFMQSSLDKLVKNLTPDQLVNMRRHQEVSEAGNDDDRDYESDRSDDDEAMDSEDEAFIDDGDTNEPMSNDSDEDADDEEDVQWMGKEIERLITSGQRYGLSESDDEDNNAFVQTDACQEPRPDLISDDDDDAVGCYSHLVNQHERFSAVDALDNLEDMVRAADNMEEHYRDNPFSMPQLTAEERERAEAKIKLRSGKGFYPYEYMDSFERFNETALPPKEAFFSSLKGEGISDEDYTHAQNVWSTFECKTMRDYHDLYLVTDVLLLADVMHAFRGMCLENYKLDPWRYCTVPGLTWDAGLRMTRVHLKRIEDIDTHLFIEAGMRGGVSVISQRYAKASADDDVDEEGRRDHLMYYDANNLYGHAMVQYLPTGGFVMETETQIENRKANLPETTAELMSIAPDAKRGCTVEADFDIPEELHDLFADFPLAPEKRALAYEMLSPKQRELLYAFDDNPEKYASVEKLVPNLEPKRKYVMHYQNLQLYLSLGMKLVNIHRVLWFDQSPWLKKYIDFNTLQRTLATSEFAKDFFKLMNNAMFGKTMENVRNRRNLELVTTTERHDKLAARPTFRTSTIISKDLCAVENYQTSVILNKPGYVGFSVLELSKKLMVKFVYDYIKRLYPGPLSTLLFTDTDSLCYRLRTKDVYADMLANADEFDWSGYPATHPVFSGMSDNAIAALQKQNKKVIGKMKDELDGYRMSEFVGVRAKCYSFEVDERDRDAYFTKKRSTMKNKGISSAVVKHQLVHDDYRKCVLESQRKFVDIRSVRSYAHQIHTLRQVKLALINFDDKRWMCDDGLATLPHGHYQTK